VSRFGDRSTSLDTLVRGDRGWVRDHRGCGDRDGARLRTAAVVCVTVPGSAVRRCVLGVLFLAASPFPERADRCCDQPREAD